MPGSYLSPAQIVAVQRAIRELCTALKPDFMTLVDAVAPHDFLLRSCLGHSDGQVRTGRLDKLGQEDGQVRTDEDRRTERLLHGPLHGRVDISAGIRRWCRW